MDRTGIPVIIRPWSVAVKHDRRHLSIPDCIYDKCLKEEQPEDWELYLAPPYKEPDGRKQVAYFTMWETSRLKQEHVDNINDSDIAIVPSTWGRNCFRSSGVRVPIHVNPLGCDPDVFRPSPMPDCSAFVFATAGRVLHGKERKGVNESIRAFMKAFPDETDVRLMVKCLRDDPMDEIPKDGRIQVTRDYLTRDQFASWLARCHCFISLAKAEGWGYIQHQSMMIGRPVISHLWGGVADYLNLDNCYPVPHTLVEPPEGNYFKDMGYWAEPDEDAAISQMRRAYKNRDEAARIGRIAQLSVSHLTEDRSGARLLEILRSNQIV
jgi:glycosyltransferase involved in cell wall biosynthesis